MKKELKSGIVYCNGCSDCWDKALNEANIKRKACKNITEAEFKSMMIRSYIDFKNICKEKK